MIEVCDTSRRDFFARHAVNAIRGGDVEPLRIRLRAKRTHPPGNIQDFLPAPLFHRQREVAGVFLERAAEQDHAIQLQALLFHSSGSPLPLVSGAKGSVMRSMRNTALSVSPA